MVRVVLGAAFAEGEASTPTQQFIGIWDTGASGTAISKKVADALGLISTKVTKVYHAQGETLANVYLVSLGFPDSSLRFKELSVNEAVVYGADVLVGMDVISQGDFLITNDGASTELHFHHPAVGLDRFARKIKKFPIPGVPKPPVPEIAKLGRNDPCFCGSGKKFKNCCIGKPGAPHV
jgi:predicted aspartyl protease